MKLEDLEKKLYQKNPEGVPGSPKKKEPVVSYLSDGIRAAATAVEYDWIME